LSSDAIDARTAATAEPTGGVFNAYLPVKEQIRQAAQLCKQSMTKWATEQLRQAAGDVLQNKRRKSDVSP
jgi:hypothetical protein